MMACLMIKGFAKWYISVIQDFWLFQMLGAKSNKNRGRGDDLEISFNLFFRGEKVRNPFSGRCLCNQKLLILGELETKFMTIYKEYQNFWRVEKSFGNY